MGKGRKRKPGEHGTLDNLGFWLRILYRESPGFVWLYLLEIVLGIAISLLDVYMPSVLVADITAGKGVWRILQDLVLLGGGLACLYMLNQWIGQTQTVCNSKISHNMSLRLCRAAMEADYADIERADYPEEFWQLQERHIWSGEYTTMFLKAFAGAATAVIGMVLYMGMLSGLSLWVLLLVVAGTALNYATGIHCSRWDAKNRHKWWDLDNKMYYLAHELSSYEASKDVHLYNMSPWLGKKYDKELKERIRHTVRQQGNYFLQGTVEMFSRSAWESAAYLYLIYLVCDGRMDAAGFVFYFGVITGFANWCNSIVNAMRQLHKEASYVNEERNFLGRLQKEEEGHKEELVMKEGHIPEISFVNVTFQYPGADSPVLRDLNLTMKPGENLALVGLNGAGKTTFIKLLCGFYDPTQGEILIDGKDRRRYSRKSWLNMFSGVFQDAGDFSLTLEENLALGAKVDERRIRDSLKMADLDSRVDKLPKGMRTMLGKGVYEDGVEFSGGEMQKLMLARALYKEAPLLVLDEPTAALDPLMESELYEKYRHFSEHKTTVFISHRLASTRFCDRILLMEDGVLLETGTHEELLLKDGKYAWMFRLQSKYYQREEAGLA